MRQVIFFLKGQWTPRGKKEAFWFDEYLPASFMQKKNMLKNDNNLVFLEQSQLNIQFGAYTH